MKIKLDENMPMELIAELAAMGHDVDTVSAEGLCGQDDEAVWQAAQREDRLVITQDMDFSDLRQFLPGTHSGVVLTRLRKPSRRRLTERVSAVFAVERVEDWRGAFVIVADNKLRVRKSNE